jgi:hypothetical protein
MVLLLLPPLLQQQGPEDLTRPFQQQLLVHLLAA